MLVTPRSPAHTDLEVAVDTGSLAHPRSPEPREERPHACLEGVVFVGHLVVEDGQEVERVEGVRCRRCAGEL